MGCQGCRATKIHTLLKEKQNGAAPLENSLAISYKIKNDIQSNHLTPRYLHKLDESYAHSWIAVTVY